MAEVKEKVRPKTFGPSFPGHFPEEMRRQMWPLCCGFSILSGFKNVKLLTPEELVADIEYICTIPRPDFQIFKDEHMRPAITFLTLNESQMDSKKIMDAIKATKFNLVGIGQPRGSTQGLFIRDTSGTWKAA